MTDQCFELLSLHSELWEVFKSHDYIPPGKSYVLNQIDAHHKEMFRSSPTNFGCQECVFAMFKRMFRAWEEEKKRRELKPQEALVIEQTGEGMIVNKPKKNGRQRK